MSDLLDFGGKYLYLRSLYDTNVDHDTLKQVVYYISTTALGILTFIFALILLSPFGRNNPPVPQGCRKYGRKSKQQLLPRPSSTNSGSSEPSTPTVQSLWLYPIKSCVGIELDEAEIIVTGIKYDRQFSFAQLHSPFPLSVNDSKASKSAHQWRFITQREFPLLSQVHTELWVPDPSAEDYATNAPYVKTGGAIIVSFPYEEDGLLGTLKSFVARLRGTRVEKSFLIPFNPTPEQQRDYTLEELKIWKDTPLSLNMSPILPPELKYFLGVRNPFALFRVHTERELYRCAPRKESLGWQPIVGFADAYPLNILGLSSLHALSQMQPAGFPTLSFQRFRANIAMEGSEAFEEEEWRKVRIGDEVYFVCCRCVRCGIPNIDPSTGVKNRQEPYKTLVNKRNVDAGSPQYGCLAMQMVPVKTEGWIRVGDRIEVLERGEHMYQPM